MRVTICWLLLALAAPLSSAAEYPPYGVIPTSAYSTQPAPLPKQPPTPENVAPTPKLDLWPAAVDEQPAQELGRWRGEDFDSAKACIYGRAEYLFWLFKDADAPPLVTTAPAGVLPILGGPGTRVLAGGELDGEEHSGARLTLGFLLPLDCLDFDCSIALEATFLSVAPNSNSFSASSPGTPVLGRPFTDLSTGLRIPSVENIANLAGVGGVAGQGGTVAVDNASRLSGLELNTVFNLDCGCWGSGCGNHLQLLFGYRGLALHEDLAIRENLLALDGTNESNRVRDAFSTRNNFNGLQMGLRGERTFGRLFVQATGKLALGANNESISIQGVTINTLPGTPAVIGRGGLLAQASNSGKRSHEEFCMVPETELRMGVALCSNVRLSAGYNLLYLSRVARPGDQIDLGVNTNQQPTFVGGVAVPGAVGNGPARPAPLFQQSDFWAHGLTASVELSW